MGVRDMTARIKRTYYAVNLFNIKISLWLSIFCAATVYSAATFALEVDKKLSVSVSNKITNQWRSSAIAIDLPNKKISKKPINRFIIKFKDGVDKTVRADVARKYSLQTVKEYRSIPDVSVVIIKDANPEAMLAKFKADPRIEYIERDQVIHLLAMPDDAQLNAAWSLGNSFDTDINASEAWDINKGNRDNVLAVIDTGVAYRHEDLIDNMWRNPNEIPGNGIDDDNNGYIDDIYGIDPGDADSDPFDDVVGHGTHVAGTIAATGNNGVGISGVNQVASILACKIFGQNVNSLESFVSVAIECLDYIWALKTQQGVNIVASNASWGWGGKYSKAMYDALRKHQDAGILFVAAAGNSILNNDSLLDFPSTYDLSNIIAVSAGNVHNEQTFFSNYGEHTVHLTAPGENILSTLPDRFVEPTVLADVFFDDMENGVTNWIADPEWGLTGASHSGLNAWSDSPIGPYANNAVTSLQSTVIDLSAYNNQTLYFSFYINYQLEPGLDELIVETTNDSGVTWNEVSRLTGFTNNWEFLTFPIAVSSQFAMRFRLVANASFAFDGVSIDDVSISTVAAEFPADSNYGFASGTSMAAPHVVGALGLLKSHDASRDWRQLKNLVIAGGVPFDTLNQPTISDRRLRLIDVDGRGSMSCINQIVQGRLRPTQKTIDIVDDNSNALKISYLNINCDQPAGDVTVIVKETGQRIIMLDNGVGFDQVAGDGVYSISTNLSNLNSDEVELQFPNGDEMKVRLNPSYQVSSPAYDSIELNLPDILEVPSDSFLPITPPFSIDFYGKSYDQIYVYQDGMVGFNFPRILGFPHFYNLQLPNRNYEALIAPFWSDMETNIGQIVKQTIGQAPNRQFVIEWQNVTAYAAISPEGANFQLIFYENSKNIRVNYQDVTFDVDSIFNGGGTATIGFQASSTLGMMYSFDEPLVTDQSSLLWTYIPPTTVYRKPSSSNDGGGALIWMLLILLGFAWRSYTGGLGSKIRGPA